MRHRLQAQPRKLLAAALFLAGLMPALAASAQTFRISPGHTLSNRVALTREPDGGWIVRTLTYTAHVNPGGYLDSLRTPGNIEMMGAPFEYQPEGHLLADSMKADGDSLHVHLKGNGDATVDYHFQSGKVTVTPTWLADGYAAFRFAASKSLLGIELLNYKGLQDGGEATWFSDHGEVRGVPAVPSSRNQRVRFLFGAFDLLATIHAWGAPFNIESIGSISGYGWGRPLLGKGHAVPITFEIEYAQPSALSASGAPSELAAIPFIPQAAHAASLYYTAEPCNWTIHFPDPERKQQLLNAGIHQLRASYQIFDVNGREEWAHSSVISLNTAPGAPDPTIHLATVGSGYYTLRVQLRGPDHRLQESSFQTRFTVIHHVPGLFERQDALWTKGMSDTAVMAMVGTGCIRESHNIGEFFTNQAPNGEGWVSVEGAPSPVWMNTRALDSVVNNAHADSALYHVPWFFQANSRPSWATPAIYESISRAMVGRYHDRCPAWEVENEPNFRYKPTDYIQQALIPFARGAKEADPHAIIMGPACVSLKQTLEFMDAIYKAGANRWLDRVSTHTYPGPGESWAQFGTTATIAELRQWMNAHGDGKKEIWQTEQGYDWGNSPKLQAARYTVRQFLQGARLGIAPDHQYYFYPQAHGFEPWYLQGGGEAGSENSWLPSAAALRFFAENTHGRRYVGDLPSPYKGIFLSRFHGPSDDVIAIWTFDFPDTLHLHINGPVQVVDFMGNAEPFEDPLTRDAAGNVLLPVSGEPIYLHVAPGAPVRVVDPYGPNLALASVGTVMTASSFTKGHEPSAANDGNWQLWEDVIGLPGRTFWQSAHPNPSSKQSDWIQAQFLHEETINRVVALCYLPAVNPSPRVFTLEVHTHGRWIVVPKPSPSAFLSWVMNWKLSPVQADAVRMKITQFNDGWLQDRRWIDILIPGANHYTDSQMRVSELEVYGPPQTHEANGGESRKRR